MTADGTPPAWQNERGAVARVDGRRDVSSRVQRLLVVSYLFPPDGAIGGLRWAGITKYLARAGWPIHVLTSGEPERPPLFNHVAIHPVRRAATLNDAYRRITAGRSKTPSTSAGSPDPGHAAPERSLRRTVAVCLRYPDYSRGWVLRAARAARRIIKRERIETVVSSGPPHTTHVVAMIATAGTRTRWIMDMRDPWSDMERPEIPELLLRAERRVERVAFSRADRIICNTRQYAAELSERGIPARVHWIPNAIDLEDLPAPAEPPAGPLTLAYVGTLYLNRDLGPILRAMKLATRPAGATRRIRLRFVGHADPQLAELLMRQVADSGLASEQVERLGRVSREAAWKVLQEAHLSLVLAQGQPMQVPAKLYESMGMGVQTLVLAEPGSAAAEEAVRIGALWKDPNDVDGIREIIEKLDRGEISHRARPAVRFDYEEIAAEVGRLLSEGPR